MAKKQVNKKQVKGKTSQNKIKKLSNDLKKIKSDFSDIKEKNIRLLAEFDNYKRRILKNQDKLIKYEGMNLVQSLLSVIDDIDRTIKLKELRSNKVLFNGLKMIKDKFEKKLKEQGVVAYKSLGKEFNTEYHEALMTKKSKKKSNIILEEFEQGYLYHDRVIRHAKVVVSK